MKAYFNVIVASSLVGVGLAGHSAMALGLPISAMLWMAPAWIGIAGAMIVAGITAITLIEKRRSSRPSRKIDPAKPSA